MERRSETEISNQIQRATIKLFTVKGYNKITMVEVASEAKVAKRTLYRYYPSKIELFASIFDQYLQMLIDEEKAQSFKGLGYGETLQKIFSVLYSFTKKHQDFMRLFWMLNTETLEGDVPEELYNHIHNRNNEMINSVAAYLQQKLPGGLFERYSPELVIDMLSAFNKGLFLQMGKKGDPDINNKSNHDLFDLVREMLIYCDQPPVN